MAIWLLMFLVLCTTTFAKQPHDAHKFSDSVTFAKLGLRPPPTTVGLLQANVDQNCTVSLQDCAEGLFCNHDFEDTGHCQSCVGVDCRSAPEDRAPCCIPNPETCEDVSGGFYVENTDERREPVEYCRIRQEMCQLSFECTMGRTVGYIDNVTIITPILGVNGTWQGHGNGTSVSFNDGFSYVFNPDDNLTCADIDGNYIIVNSLGNVEDSCELAQDYEMCTVVVSCSRLGDFLSSAMVTQTEVFFPDRIWAAIRENGNLVFGSGEIVAELVLPEEALVATPVPSTIDTIDTIEINCREYNASPWSANTRQLVGVTVVLMFLI